MSGPGFFTYPDNNNSVPWMLPHQVSKVVARQELTDRLTSILLDEIQEDICITTSVEGAGGFGKTTLVREVCNDHRIREHYSGGLLWVTIGESRTDTEIADVINYICELMTDEHMTTADPILAGARLGNLLDHRARTLLVIDDVWSQQQLGPFLIGGNSCQRVITTRNRRVAPDNSHTVLVDEMTFAQAQTLLSSEVRGLSSVDLDRLSRLTGRWPVLLGLASIALAEYVRDGLSPSAAAAYVVQRLEVDGPDTLDLDDSASRERAVSATIAVTLSHLSPDEVSRVMELGIFPEDAEIPQQIVGLLWSESGGMTFYQISRLCEKLLRLRLVIRAMADGQLALRLHDVLRSYFWHKLGESGRIATHGSMVRAMRKTTAIGGSDYPIPWWTMPSDTRYFWSSLIFHMSEANLTEEARVLANDLRWIIASIKAHGSTLAAETDLNTLGDTNSLRLKRALGRIAYFLPPPRIFHALESTLLARLDGNEDIEPVLNAYRRSARTALVENVWPPPDRPKAGDVRSFVAHDNWVPGCAFSPDGSLVASAGADGTLRLWNVATGSAVSVLHGHEDWVLGCTFSPDGSLVASAGADGTLRLWNVATGSDMSVLHGHEDWVLGCTFSPDGSLVASAGADGTLRLWNVAASSAVSVLHGHTGRVLSCAFSPDGSVIASSGADGTTRIWDVRTGQLVSVLYGNDDWSINCVFSPDGRSLASVSSDSEICVWDVPSGSERITLSVAERVLGCGFSRDGTSLIAAHRDGSIQAWDLADGSPEMLWPGTSDLVTASAFSRDGRWAALADHTGRLLIKELSDRTAERDENVRSVRTLGCAFTSDAKLVASVTHGGKVFISQLSDGAVVSKISAHVGRAVSCDFSPDAKFLASASDDGDIKVWEVTTGSLAKSLNGHNGLVVCCSFSPDGMYISSVGSEGTLNVWDLAEDNTSRIVLEHSARAVGCRFLSDGRSIMSAYSDGMVRVLDLLTEQENDLFRYESAGLVGCSFSNRGEFFASVDGAGRVRIVRLSAGQQVVSSLAGESEPAVETSFSPDSRLLVSVGVAGTVDILDVLTGRRVGSIFTARPLFGCRWSQDPSIFGVVGDAGVYMLRYRQTAAPIS
jgi:WD40 repeat protein